MHAVARMNKKSYGTNNKVRRPQNGGVAHMHVCIQPASMKRGITMALLQMPRAFLSSGLGPWASGLGHRASGIKHRASGLRPWATGLGHRASGLRAREHTAIIALIAALTAGGSGCQVLLTIQFRLYLYTIRDRRSLWSTRASI